ncbi:MAG: addiction module protein [Verrucomicrobiales bacterium]|nr:addiction module protein [Verrucomicrobiales bacterium]
MTVDQIREQVVLLSDQEKSLLAGDILASIAPSTYDVSDDEVIERVQELEEGKVQDISFDELKRRLGR